MRGSTPSRLAGSREGRGRAEDGRIAAILPLREAPARAVASIAVDSWGELALLREIPRGEALEYSEDARAADRPLHAGQG